MNDFKFVSEEYSFQNSENYRTSIQVNPDGFSVLIVLGNKPVKIIHRQTGSTEESCKLFKTEEEFIKLRELPYQSIRLLMNTTRACLIPSGLPSEINEKGLFSTEFTPHSNFNVKSDTVNSEVKLIYEMNPKQERLVSGFRNQPEVLSLGSKFIKYSLQYITTNKKGFFIFSSPDTLHLFYKNSDKPEYYNALHFTHDDELLYHLMNTLRNLDVRGNIFYSGHIAVKSSVWKLIIRYLPNIHNISGILGFDLAWDVNVNYFNLLMQSNGANYQW